MTRPLLVTALILLALSLVVSFISTSSFLPYLVFSAVFNMLLLNGFRKNAYFLDTFTGVFFWIGFWLKYAVREIFCAGTYNDATGAFNFSRAAYDHALLVSACGGAAILFAIFVRDVWRFRKKTHVMRTVVDDSSLGDLYRKHRVAFISGFLLVVLAVGVSNEVLGIYQRGTVPRTVLPLGGSQLYTWLLLFGLASISAVILNFESRRTRTPYTGVFAALVECFSSSISLLSRGFILNAGALLWGLFKTQGQRLRNQLQFKAIAILGFILLFAVSVSLVGFIRMSRYSNISYTAPDAATGVAHNTLILFIDRWVGLEGVMAVSSFPQLGTGLFKTALAEKYSPIGTSYYDREIARSYYLTHQISNTHYISLCGLIAFFYLRGSYIFLFGAIFFIYTGSGLIEWLARRLTANLILCSLIGEIIAYRFTSFGYVPKQSYLLVGTLLANILIIYGAIYFARLWAKSKASQDR